MSQHIRKLDSDVSERLKSQACTVSLASAVREIVQNSVDAHATTIDVMIDLPNLSFAVYDDGIGLTRSDLNILATQNYTSKIRKMNDLVTMKTYGYRGDALYSISNVSKLFVCSKKKDYNSAWMRKFPSKSVMLSENTILPIDPFWKICPWSRTKSGTVVIVEDMLYNLPVRRRILKEEPPFKTFNTIKADMLQILVMHPMISLNVQYTDKLRINTEVLFRSKNITEGLTKHQQMSQVLRNVFGAIIPPDMLKKVSLKFNEYQIEGIISKMPVRLKDLQFIYINGRRYADSAFQGYVDSLFQAQDFGEKGMSLLKTKSVGKPYRSHPVFILDVRCPQTIDDLLQDPAKKIVKPSHIRTIEPLIVKTIRSFLTFQGYLTPDKSDSSFEIVNCSQKTATLPDSRIQISKRNQVLNSKMKIARINSYIGKPVVNGCRINNSTINYEKIKNIRIDGQKSSLRNKLSSRPYDSGFTEDYDSIGKTITDFSISRSVLAKYEVINQVDKKFILIRCLDQSIHNCPLLVLVDQHACDERIRLEELFYSLLTEVVTGTFVARDLKDCCIEVDRTEADLFKHYQSEFKKWGIGYETIEGTMETSLLEIKTLPEMLTSKYNGDKDYLKMVLLQHAHDLKDFKKLPMDLSHFENHTSVDKLYWWKYSSCVPTVFHEILNSKACRSAVMFGDELTRQECIILISKLSRCHNPFECAHGRPSMVPIAELK
ncbi:Mlh3p [Saccharomyces cerevisiae YJM1573]|nr:Mlh3p [Saccharomyces cerevisiae YJM1573]AJW05196.1 Mlh3p [Saccharomyces cerevisiae YJM1402]CAI4828489.1 BBL_G0053540.mRNA.1.CDS.1 [Saccharomyces cerevisiae]CAI7371487.1 BBL_G0053540.mRNA.1.CDS.1 [Saccharomyces cerevisiae]